MKVFLIVAISFVVFTCVFIILPAIRLSSDISREEEKRRRDRDD
jgi:hypothetical protein